MSDSTEQTLRMLVVDDEMVVQSLVRDAMEDEGHFVDTASNGEDALNILATKPIDLLITDIRMPRMSGIELAERARAMYPEMGVVFITGYASLNTAKDAIKQGALDYVMKPFELSEIRQAIRNAIDKLAEARESATDEQLDSLSDLSHVLFETGDRRALVNSSLKFAMMHLHCDHGSILHWDPDQNQYAMLSLSDSQSSEIQLGSQPLLGLVATADAESLGQPCLVRGIEEHPLFLLQPDDALRPFLTPPWFGVNSGMISVPIMRGGTFMGLFMLATDEDTVKVRQTDLKFLSIASSQLAISLENIALLEETQQAYTRLKELQDETIELEKMATRGEMSAEIGHELNNFLGVVAGNVAMLQVNLQKGNYEQLNKYLDSTNSTLEKIRSFTANLMDLRPISSERETIYFNRILTEVVEYLRPQKRFRGVDIQLPDDAEDIPVRADVTQLQQLLYNLFNNAADAMTDESEKRITVELTKSVTDNRFRFVIVDTGRGFDSENLMRAFSEKFTTKDTGHGFGLIVCKRIIDYHQGELELASAPGEGTRISIAFPLAEEPVAEPAEVSV
ncbi:response regulator [candidate division GN15 bacterium]|nr:response regulator [candidate division GN15 bacterium]